MKIKYLALIFLLVAGCNPRGGAPGNPNAKVGTGGSIAAPSPGTGGQNTGGGPATGGDKLPPTPTSFSSCKSIPGQAVVCGQAFASDATTPIAGADVNWVSDAAGSAVANPPSCKTDATGVFVCGGPTQSGPCGYQIVGHGFKISFSATCTVDSTTTASKSDTTAVSSSTTKKFAVLKGTFDTIQNVLNRVYCGDKDCSPTVTVVDDIEKFLSNFEGMNGYDAIFINCGVVNKFATDPAVKANLKKYVEEGKSLYVSDQAYDYLEQVWPDALSFFGSYQEGKNTGLSSDPEAPDSANIGNASVGASPQPVDVVDSGLSTWLNATTFNVDFDLPFWAVMTDAAPFVKQLLTAKSLVNGVASLDPKADPHIPLPGKSSIPISVSFPKGKGCVFYSSYHNEPADKVGETTAQAQVLKYLVVNKLGSCQ